MDTPANSRASPAALTLPTWDAGGICAGESSVNPNETLDEVPGAPSG